jgi:hypothetical protein
LRWPSYRDVAPARKRSGCIRQYCLRNQIYKIGGGTSQAGYAGISFKLNGDGDSGAL